MERKTAEEIIEDKIKNKIGVYWSEIYSADRAAIVKVAKQYAAQETAALQKQNAELLELIKKCVPVLQVANHNAIFAGETAYITSLLDRINQTTNNP